MKLKAPRNNHILVISITAALVSLIMTPWVNVDSLIIPKLILFFGVSMYFSIIIFANFSHMIKSRTAKLLIILFSLMIFSLILTVLNSESPIEQQIYGKTGRGLGLLTEIATYIFILATFKFIEKSMLEVILGSLLISGTISSIYAIFQFFGLDFFQWYTRTNGIIGTLGNPNFQGAFSALTVPSAIFFILNSRKGIKFLSVCSLSILLFTIYLCQSTQGYILFLLSVNVMILLFLWYKNLLLFNISIFLSFNLLIVGVFGMLNQGPLANYLYKVSVQSRGEFWRTAVSTFRDNPVFGVGLDSFGDYSQRYKSAIDAAGINEFTDNAHNYFLNYAANNGIFYVLMYTLVVLLVLISFIKILKTEKKFNLGIVAIFACWVCFQAQSLISPGTISLIAWNAIFSGAILGLYSNQQGSDSALTLTKVTFIKPIGIFIAFIGILAIYPLYKVDSLQLKSLNSKDALLGVKSATSFPESTLRYSRIGVELIKSELWDQALIVGRSAVKFNPNSVSAWALILANVKAPLEERIEAKNEILRLDPYNEEIRNLTVSNE